MEEVAKKRPSTSIDEDEVPAKKISLEPSKLVSSEINNTSLYEGQVLCETQSSELYTSKLFLSKHTNSIANTFKASEETPSSSQFQTNSTEKSPIESGKMVEP